MGGKQRTMEAATSQPASLCRGRRGGFGHRCTLKFFRTPPVYCSFIVLVVRYSKTADVDDREIG